MNRRSLFGALVGTLLAPFAALRLLVKDKARPLAEGEMRGEWVSWLKPCWGARTLDKAVQDSLWVSLCSSEKGEAEYRLVIGRQEGCDWKSVTGWDVTMYPECQELWVKVSVDLKGLKRALDEHDLPVGSGKCEFLVKVRREN